MSAFAKLEKRWLEIEAEFMASHPMQRLAEGAIDINHYAAYLRETYFYTREDPQIQASATAHFRLADREMVKHFLRHALSEVGHDQMTLADLVTLGCGIQTIPDENPLPDTIAMTSLLTG